MQESYTDTDTATQPTTSSLQRKLLGGLVLILVAGFAYGGYVMYTNLSFSDDAPQPPINPAELTDFTYGILVEEESQTLYKNMLNSAGGVLMYDRIGFVEEGIPGALAISTFELATAATQPYVATGLHMGLVPDSETTGTVTEFNVETSQMVPVFYDVTDNEYTALGIPTNHQADRFFKAPSGDWYAGTVSDSASQKAQNPLDLSFRSVVLYDQASDEFRIIEGAARPQWLPDGTHLLYLKTDGIYRYSMADQTETLVSDQYNSLLSITGLAVSPDGQLAVLTMPSINAISFIYLFDGGSASRELGRSREEGRVYVSPVFSPDSRFVAVVRRDQTAEAKTEDTVEVYVPTFIEPVATYALADGEFGFRSLTAWTSFTPTVPQP